MMKLTADDHLYARGPTQETEHDWEQEHVFAHKGHEYCVTVFARADYGPSRFTYTIDDDETGDSLFDSRVEGRTAGDHMRVDMALVGELAHELYDYARREAEGCAQCGEPSQGCEFCADCFR